MRTSNGEVEGPHDHGRQGPRARNIDWAPRPQTDHASRPLQRLLGGFNIPGVNIQGQFDSALPETSERLWRDAQPFILLLHKPTTE
jgi:hypothetical protein